MINSRASRQLANDLAAVAAEILAQHGDVAAQIAVYGSLLSRWEGIAPSDHAAPDWQERIDAILDAADLDAIAEHYNAQSKRPAIYLYELFLHAYDPGVSRSRGVHYSPPGVVSYIVLGIEHLLHSHLGGELADALIVDPCCGIGTFLSHIEEHRAPAPRLIGLELSQAACELATRILKRTEVGHADWLADMHLDTAGRTLVILGNPPYSGHSANPGAMAELLADYRDGIRERNPKWLQDDYVKFIRMAQHRIEQAGRGIVAFITNHNYLTNPTFRAMRHSLMRSFDHLYVLDLHGDARRVDRSLDMADQNVFPVRMGVAISFFVKISGQPDCQVRHAEITGTREKKLGLLSRLSIADTPWQEVHPTKPFSVLVRRDSDLEQRYSSWPSILDFFRETSVGFVTSRDRFAVDFDCEPLLQRIAALRDESVSPEELQARYPVGDLDIAACRQALQPDLPWEDAAVPVLYRPFDYRWAYLSPAVMERPRLPFMRSLLQDNVAIAVGRSGRATGSTIWDVVFCTDRPADLNLFRRGGAMLLPRWTNSGDRRLSNVYGSSLEHDVVFPVIYAILYSNIYRTRCADFLATDFPRIPPINDASMIRDLAALGQRLMDLHTMRAEPKTTLPEAEPFTIGGYPVPEKWLKDRRQRALTSGDHQHVEVVRRVVAETAALSKQIDETLGTGFLSTH